MQKLTLSLLCTGLITTMAMAKENCLVFYEAQNYKKSAQCYIQKLKKDRSFANLSSAGISYCEQGRYKEALPYLKEAENKATTTSDYTVLYSGLSNVYANIGDSVQELAYDMKFLDLSLKSGDRENIGIAYINLGDYYYKQKQFQKALESSEKALEYQDESERATTYGNMAGSYDDLKNYPKAEEMYQRSIEIDQKLGNYNDLGGHKKELGIFYFGQKRYVEARKTLEEGKTISHNAGNIGVEAHSLSILSIVDYREGHINEAKAKAAEGLRLAKQSGAEAILDDANYAWNLVNGK
jgi:tetratricopeptide (TPR) repeat protein